MKDSEKPSYEAALKLQPLPTPPPPTATRSNATAHDPSSVPDTSPEQPPPYSRNNPDAINFITTPAAVHVQPNPYYHPSPTHGTAGEQRIGESKLQTAYTADPEPERVYKQVAYRELPHWLRRNLQAAVTTVWLIWLPCFVLITFAILMKDDLSDEYVSLSFPGTSFSMDTHWVMPGKKFT